MDMLSLKLIGSDMPAVFLKLLNMSIAASWLVLAVLILRMLFRKAPKMISCILWGLVGIRLVCPFSVESIFSLIPSAETVPPEIVYAEKPTIHSGVSYLNAMVNPVISETLAPVENADTVNYSPMQVIISIATVIWLMGVIAMVCYGVISCVRLYRRTRESLNFNDAFEARHDMQHERLDKQALTDMQNDKWDICVKEQKKPTKGRRSDIRLCDRISSPFILGLFRPQIFLPSSMNEADMAYVIAHEMAHLKRRDHWWKPIGFALLTVYWFNPLMWVAYILLCRDIELACDERVIKDMGTESKKPYLQALINCSAPQKIVSACPLAFGEVGVERRIRNVLHYKRPAFWISASAIFICVTAAICFLTNPKEVSKEPDLSFLNYENAIPLVADSEEIVVIHYPPVNQNESSRIEVGVTDGNSLAGYLDNVSWKECEPPKGRLSSPKSLEFVINGTYRISVYKRKNWITPSYAVVKHGAEIRYYKAGAGDYEDAVAIVKASDLAKNAESIAVSIPASYSGIADLKLQSITYACDDSPELFKPTLHLALEDNCFQFSYSSFSSLGPPIGYYEITDTELILTEDYTKMGADIQEYFLARTTPKKFVFTRVGDSYRFEEGKSSLLPRYAYSAGAPGQSPVPDQAIFNPILYRYDVEDEKIPIIDCIRFDIDKDGVEEICTLSYGPTSDLFTFVISVREHDEEELEYFNMFTSEYYDLSFILSGSRDMNLIGWTPNGEPEEYYYFDIRFEDGNIALYMDMEEAEEQVAYWGEQGVNSKWAK